MIVLRVLASSSPPEPKADDFFPSLFRDTTGSHLAQAILTVAPTHIFDILWRLHFVGKIGKLSSHPIGNFVVSTGVRRASEDQMRRIIEELKAVDPSTLIRECLACLQMVQYSSLTLLLLQGSAKTSVLQALVSRAGTTGHLRGEVSNVGG